MGPGTRGPAHRGTRRRGQVVGHEFLQDSVEVSRLRDASDDPPTSYRHGISSGDIPLGGRQGRPWPASRRLYALSGSENADAGTERAGNTKTKMLKTAVQRRSRM